MSSIIKALWAGLPAWSDFGGRADKRNYADRPVSNPQTQTDAKEYVSLALAVTQMAPTSPFAVLKVSVGNSTNYVMGYKSQAGLGFTLAPVVEPSPSGTGRYLLKWPTTLTDQAGVVSNVNIGYALATKIKNAASVSGMVFETLVTAPNIIEIGIWNPATVSYVGSLCEFDMVVFSL